MSRLALEEGLIQIFGAPEKKRMDIGRFYSDSAHFRERVGWTPSSDLRERLSRTLEHYRAHMLQYLEVAGGRPLERR
jgi:nucleoside-diphosphate-sugar epimerase